MIKFFKPFVCINVFSPTMSLAAVNSLCNKHTKQIRRQAALKGKKSCHTAIGNTQLSTNTQQSFELSKVDTVFWILFYVLELHIQEVCAIHVNFTEILLFCNCDT